MPPMYCWVEKNTGTQIEVVRNFSEYQVPPTEEESGINPEQANWERIIGGGIKTIRGSNWGPGKGHW